MRGLHAVGLTSAVLLLAGVSAGFQKAPQPPLPYKSIDDPEFIRAADAHFLSDGDRLIGIAAASAVKAYPAAILAQHGVVLDRMPDGPIAVTW